MNVIIYGNVIKICKRICIEKVGMIILWNCNIKSLIYSYKFYWISDVYYLEDNIFGVFFFENWVFFNIWMIKMWRCCYFFDEYFWVVIVYICYKIF